jgi:hypothetical protein
VFGEKKFGVPPSGGSFRIAKIPPEGGTPNESRTPNFFVLTSLETRNFYFEQRAGT